MENVAVGSLLTRNIFRNFLFILTQVQLLSRSSSDFKFGHMSLILLRSVLTLLNITHVSFNFIEYNSHKLYFANVI